MLRFEHSIRFDSIVRSIVPAWDNEFDSIRFDSCHTVSYIRDVTYVRQWGLQCVGDRGHARTSTVVVSVSGRMERYPVRQLRTRTVVVSVVVRTIPNPRRQVEYGIRIRTRLDSTRLVLRRVSSLCYGPTNFEDGIQARTKPNKPMEGASHRSVQYVAPHRGYITGWRILL